MTLTRTNHADGKHTGVGWYIPVNTTADGTCATITAKYEAIGINDILTLKHYPRTVILTRWNLK